MRGKDIPPNTVYTIHTNGKITKHTEPLYTLKPMEEVKTHQDKLGKNAAWYYGTDCEKCCGVYPAFMKEMNFNDNGYYVCLVCGKESIHTPMPWQARDYWNAGQYLWEPTTEYEQMTLFDWMKEAK